MWCQPPFWAPNSQSLYFFGEGQAGRGLFRVSAGGGESILMQRGASAAAISPDGNSVVFLAPSPDDRKLIVWTASPPQGERRAYEPAPLRATGFRNRPVLAFRPNGKSVFLLISLGKETQAWDLPWPPDRSRRVFTKAERSVGAPLSIRWMPDSQHLIFAADALAVADIATERYWPIAVQDRPMKSPTPSPDGKRVAYQSSLSHADVIAVPLDGGAIETLAGSMAWEEMPASSPVAAQITYKSAKNPSGIWIKNLADGSERNLVEQRTIRVAGERVEFLATPVFSGNGKKILFGAVGPAGGTLFTVPADGGSPVRTAEAIDGGTAFTWSPDEKWIAFRRTNENRPRLMKVRAGTAEPAVELASLCGRCMPEWSPTGEWIAYTNESCRLALIRPDKSESRLLGDSGTVAWSRDGATLYRISAEKRTLTAIDVATGRERILRDLGDLLPYSGPQPGLRASLTADGKKIVYSVLRPREEIWILEDVQIREPWYVGLLSRFRR
jgi:Tol biopolymer transport system component